MLPSSEKAKPTKAPPGTARCSSCTRMPRRSKIAVMASHNRSASSASCEKAPKLSTYTAPAR
eukprot:469392-Lingulodinium_polyedra.AAC.1